MSIGWNRPQTRDASMIRTLILFTLAEIACQAQSVTLGGPVRGGAFSASSGGAAGGLQVGIEGCVLCADGLGLFAEYSHWFSVGRGIGDRVSSSESRRRWTTDSFSARDRLVLRHRPGGRTRSALFGTAWRDRRRRGWRRRSHSHRATLVHPAPISRLRYVASLARRSRGALVGERPPGY